MVVLLSQVEVTTAVGDIAQAIHDFESNEEGHVKTALSDLSAGMHALAEAVKTCHLDELADVITSQAAKLGLANVEILETVVHVLING